MNRVQLISLGVGLIFLFQVSWLTSRHRLRDRHAFFWIVLALVGVLIGLTLPQWNQLAQRMGIVYMPTFMFLVGFLITFTILVYQTIVLSSHQEKIKTLAQELSFLKHETPAPPLELEQVIPGTPQKTMRSPDCSSP